MRIVFMGSSAFACPALDALRADPGYTLACVVTQPDRPRGRRLETAPCPVRRHLGGAAVEVLTPERVNAPDSVAAIRTRRPDVIVVVAYGQMLRAELLALPPHGCLNVHGSLLPRYRGAAPVAWAVANGETVTGVTTLFMNERMDAGDILLQAAVPIEPDDTGGTLGEKLAAAGADLLMRSLAAIRAGTAPRRPQDESLATLAPKLNKTDGRLDWRTPARVLHNRVRAFNPWPCATCRLPGEPPRILRVLRTRVAPGGEGPSGRVLDAGRDGPVVQTGEGALVLLEVQPEGRTGMSGGDFLRGYALKAGDILQ
jgi:methionyl-tRNA formyltransferase